MGTSLGMYLLDKESGGGGAFGRVIIAPIEENDDLLFAFK